MGQSPHHNIASIGNGAAGIHPLTECQGQFPVKKVFSCCLALSEGCVGGKEN
jgi:hypothetical protein